MPVPPVSSTRPLARVRSLPSRARASSSVSMSWNLREELPQLRTRIFMTADPIRAREGVSKMVDDDAGVAVAPFETPPSDPQPRYHPYMPGDGTRIPLVPLPNIVHFPRTELKLHVIDPAFLPLVHQLEEQDEDE